MRRHFDDDNNDEGSKVVCKQSECTYETCEKLISLLVRNGLMATEAYHKKDNGIFMDALIKK